MSVDRPTLVYWEEEIVPSDTFASDCDDSSPPKEKRSLFWNPKEHDTDPGIQWARAQQQKAEKVSPHPMRTDEWRIHLKSGKRLFGTDSLDLHFSDNGFVKVLENPFAKLEASIGTWKVIPSGIRWELPVKMNTHDKNTTLHCHADLVLNPFGSKPHMVRGIIARDRYPDSTFPRHFLRPVVATFTSVGIGKDTAHVSN
jgi:hypothetical protein